MNEEEKWKHCPEKKCYYCKRNIEFMEIYQDDEITKCIYCDRSFCD